MPLIRLSYQALTAGTHEVGIAGDFTGWEIIDMHHAAGVYSLSVHLEPGEYRYKLIVDGIWSVDPGNPDMEPDPFGGQNSVLRIEMEAIPHFEWGQLIHDLSLLDERKERYIDIYRTGKEQYDVRFNWYPDLDCRIALVVDGVEHPMHRLGQDHNREVYQASVVVQQPKAKVLAKAERDGECIYYGSFGFCREQDKCVPINVDLQALEIFDIPEWVQQGVIYQIFPDRFCNGDDKLNPDFSEWYYADCRQKPTPGEILPLYREYFHYQPDWQDIAGLSQSPWQEAGKPDWWVFYGGDIPGMISKLDYLKELGVSILYLNPVWQAKSVHKYDAADFRRIDPHFGSTSDMQTLVSMAHSRGMRVILDVAFNHTGEAFWAFRDCVEKGDKSPYWNWYDWNKWPLPKPLPPDFQPKEYYQCWWGIKDMPDLNFDLSRPHPAENYVKDVRRAIPNAALVDYILDSVTWWLSDIGIDGFRLDVPDEVPYWFWQLFRRHVKSLRADAWLVGEIWHNAQGWVNQHYFDSVMNYAYFKNPTLAYMVSSEIDASEFIARIEEGLIRYPMHACRAMMNLLGSHDTWRLLEIARGDVRRVRLVTLFQFTFIGTPHIYYGDEIGIMGKKDPDNRRPMNWNWENDPQAVELRSWMRDLIRIRKEHSAFVDGMVELRQPVANVLQYRRWNAEQEIWIVINPTLSNVEFGISSHAKEIISINVDRKSESTISIDALGAIVYYVPRDSVSKLSNSAP